MPRSSPTRRRIAIASSQLRSEASTCPVALPPCCSKHTRDKVLVRLPAVRQQRGRPLEPLLGGVCSPVVLERDEELEAELDLAGLERPREGSRKLSRSGMTRSWRCGQPDGFRVHLRLASHAEVVLGVPPPDDGTLGRGAQLLGRKLADRVEHEEPRLFATDAVKQALVDEGLNGLEPRLTHRLGRLVGTAAGKHREATKEALLVTVEKVV